MSSILHEPALLAPLFAALSDDDLTRAAHVCRSWAAAEVTDRHTLWRALVLTRWPALALLRAPTHDLVDWRERFHTLARLGQSDVQHDALEKKSFVLQGRWASGALAFSSVATHRTVRTVAQSGPQSIEVRDALRIRVSLGDDAAVALPNSWRVGDHAMDDSLEVEVLVHDADTSAVAHFLCWQLR